MKADLVPLKGVITLIAGFLCVYLVYLNISVNEYQTDTETKKANANIVDVEEIAKIEDAQEIIDESIDEEVLVEEDPIVYDGMTLEELSNQLNKSLSSTISGKGYLIASYSLEKGVDPYMATAIMLQETGCKWGCSRLVRECNNVGGQKGSGCGSYSYFNSLEEGIMAFIDNLERNYISYGLTTP